MSAGCACGCGLRQDDPRHGGTGHAYSNLGCRCPLCRRANTRRNNRRRLERLTEPIPERVHGTEGGYRNWGCRCDACTAKHSAKCARYYREVLSPRTGQHA